MRRNPRLDFTKREVDIPNVGIFALAGVAHTLMPSLALLGLKHALLSSDNETATYEGLAAGQMPKFRDINQAKADPWIEAMALACAEQQANLDLGPKAKASVVSSMAAGYMPQMREHVSGLTKEVRKQMKTHPMVIQHHRRITGVVPDQLSLLAIAGVLPRQSDLPLGVEALSDRLPEPAPELEATA